MLNVLSRSSMENVLTYRVYLASKQICPSSDTKKCNFAQKREFLKLDDLIWSAWDQYK